MPYGFPEEYTKFLAVIQPDAMADDLDRAAVVLYRLADGVLMA